MKKIILGITVLALMGSCRSGQKGDLPRPRELAETLDPLREQAVKHHKIPRTIDETGQIKWIGEGYDWTEGFWPGVCWMLFDQTGDKKWKEEAVASQEQFVAHKDLTSDHDLGCIFLRKSLSDHKRGQV